MEIEHVATEPAEHEDVGVHEVAATVADTVGEAASTAHSEALEAMRAIINRQEERILCLEGKLEESMRREHQTVTEHAEQATNLAAATVVANAIEDATSEPETHVVEPVTEPVTEIEDETPEVVAEPEEKPKRRHLGLYGKRR